MPFQAIPIAMRANTTSPLEKLLYIWIVKECTIDDAPNGRGFVEGSFEELERFSGATANEVRAALDNLLRLNLLGNWEWKEPAGAGEWYADVNLPVSWRDNHERKRIKVTRDQLDILVEKARHTCAACGFQSVDFNGWHVDHIIPRSIGGADVEENLQVLCERCNSKKGARIGWLDFLG